MSQVRADTERWFGIFLMVGEMWFVIIGMGAYLSLFLLLTAMVIAINLLLTMIWLTLGTIEKFILGERYFTRRLCNYIYRVLSFDGKLL